MTPDQLVLIGVLVAVVLCGLVGIAANWIGPGGYFHTSFFYRWLDRWMN